MHRSLSGYSVLDLTNVLAGPFCCHQLAHLGAEVIKVEVPGRGDLARQLGADPALNKKNMGISFLAQNAGKKSITLNLKTEAGRDILLRMVERADVLVENFRPGVMDRLGVGYEILKKTNPSLVYCAISGYGADGPMKALPAYDQIIQGMSGIMSITGAPENAPYRVGYPVADSIGGLTAAFAISSALAGRDKNKNGQGCFIDVSMLESVISTMGWAVSNLLNAGKEPEAMGNDNVTASPSGTFKTQQSLLNLAANKQEQFVALCDVLGCPELLANPLFSQRQNRLLNRQLLTDALEVQLKKQTAKQWEALLNAAGVPAGTVLSVAEALDLPQVKNRDLCSKYDEVEGVDRSIEVVRTGFKVDGERPSVATAPPGLGEHGDKILMDLGYSNAQIQAFKDEGVL